MTSDETEQVTQPADPAAGRVDGDASSEADTEGHSMLNGELARTIGQDRARETDKLVRDGARVREARSKSGGGFLKRFGRR
jgi:hypothetical protein